MTAFELEAQEQEQLERDYADWCRRFDSKYIVERDEEPKSDNLANQKD
jgi:hypothetical protein